MPPHVAAPSGSPVYSSGGEDFDFEDEHHQAQWQGAPGATAEPLPQPTAPMQKRRRVTRACDECRRKKIKCDGKQPCTHCTVYSYDCTYDQPSNRRRNPAPQYIEALETRCQRLEQMLKAVLPDTDLNDPTIDAAIQQRRQAGNAKELLLSAPTSNLVSKASEAPKSPQKDAQLRSMIASTGQLDLDESGNWDFHGGSSGTVFMKRMREQFGGLLGGGYGTPFLPKMSKRLPLPAYDSPKSFGAESPDSGHAHTMDLPPQDVAKTLCENALMDACALLRFVHLPTFWELFSRIYETPTDHFGDCENRFLPMLYLVLSVGCMFRRGPSDTESAADYRESIDEGLKYFRAGRGLMDITECRDLTSLQALLFMILFLQSSSNLSTCYSYIGVALRSALRMGLHRNLPGSFNPIERETRRRCFWIVRKMDTYVSALLGFPRMLSDDDIDQEFPIEVDDQYITKDAVLPMPPGKISVYTASNAHTRLMKILSKVLKYVYPLKGMEQSVSCSPNSSYVVSQASIHEIESDLAEWLGKLPMQLRPGGESSPEVVRVQQLLRLSYAHVQMMLYRPFLHYVSKSNVGTERSFACAAAGVSVSRNIVHITTEMKKRGLLIGAYWFTMYTTFFAILSLVYFVLNNPDKPGTQEILADAMDGKEALAGLAKRSQAADRCTITLMGLFDQLPDRVKNPGHVAGTKKRSAPSQFPSETKPSVRSATDLKVSEPAMIGAVPRAATFPGPKTAQTGLSFNQSINNDLYLTNSASHPNLSQNFQDLINPTDISAAGTPDSGSSGQQTQYPLQPGFNSGLSNLSATMFPSTDPFAYPDQPLMEFENIKQENLSNPQAPPMFLSNGGNEPQLYDDLEGQLFGPVPPYLMQNQNFDTTGQMNAGNDVMNGMNPQNMAFPTGMMPSNEMNLGDLFSSDDWAGLISNPKYR